MSQYTDIYEALNTCKQEDGDIFPPKVASEHGVKKNI
jgi:hypothetical protein